MNKNNWVLFYREVDSMHFFFNGTKAINVHPPGEQEIFNESNCSEILTDAASNKRIRTFTISKQKYRVIARGTFITE
jgi:hypothetical protein